MRPHWLVAVGFVAFAIAPIVTRTSAQASYGDTPALQLPWVTGQSRDVSGFTYGSANQTCSGVYTTHTGLEAYTIDFGLVNEEVDAAAAGTVGAIAFDSVGGDYIWIQHPNNIQTYYGHLSTASGDIVDSLRTVYRFNPNI